MFHPVSLSNLKKILRSGQYSWPGGYPLYFIMGDGEPASHAGIRSEWKRICRAYLNQTSYDREWIVEAYEVNWENADLICCITDQPIEAAY